MFIVSNEHHYNLANKDVSNVKVIKNSFKRKRLLFTGLKNK